MVAAFITLVIILLTIVITLVNTYNYARAARLSFPASTSIASSVKLSCYIPSAASWALSFPASTSIASSVNIGGDSSR